MSGQPRISRQLGRLIAATYGRKGENKIDEAMAHVCRYIADDSARQLIRRYLELDPWLNGTLRSTPESIDESTGLMASIEKHTCITGKALRDAADDAMDAWHAASAEAVK